jgi:hypothetical protein
MCWAHLPPIQPFSDPLSLGFRAENFTKRQQSIGQASELAHLVRSHCRLPPRPLDTVRVTVVRLDSA